MNILKRLSPFLLLAALAIVGCKKDKYDLSDLHPTVKSFFTIVDNKFDINKEIKFTNASESAVSYSWDFGDGTTSGDASPVKTYKDPGAYTVTLKAVGEGGTGRYSRDITIIDPNASTGNDKVMYFIDYGNNLIKKISLQPGAAAETVASISGKAGVGLAYDKVNDKIYFTDFAKTNEGKVWRMNIDGSNMEAIVTGITDPHSIAVNTAGGKIYWADDAGNVSRANLDGTGLERQFLHINDGQMRGIAFNNKTNTIYFYEVNNEDLYSANADGSGVGKIITGAYGYSIFVDELNNKIYYEDRNKPAVMQANLDGSGIVKIADAPSTRIYGMGIDYHDNKLYWADRDKNIIRRSNLDGTANESFLSNLKSPRGVFIK